jgi:Protein of unknown function (DUF3137)
MDQLWNGYPVWLWVIAFSFLGLGAVQALVNAFRFLLAVPSIASVFRFGGPLQHERAIQALCTQRGMLRVGDVGSAFLPQMLMLGRPECRNTYATPDWSLWFSEVSDLSKPMFSSNVFAVLMFTVTGLNIPYIAVARRGAIDVPLGARGQSVQLESIEFTDRFQIHTDDQRAAVMLIDQGMMQSLLDLDRVSFQITGPLVTAIVRQRPPTSKSPAELELLLEFHDGFGKRIPELTFTEFPAPNGLAAATVQAMRMIPNLLSSRT